MTSGTDVQRTQPIAGSFRDPAGHVFSDNGVVYRQINDAGRADFDLLISSGLYHELSSDGLLIPHEALEPKGEWPIAYQFIRPRQVEFVSYPFEWSFSQLKDASLLTLAVQRRALSRGMSLKDATAFNIQFVDGRPIFIDTLSFERTPPGPWKAYRQFCQHFYAPLALARFTDSGLSRLSQLFLDGVPLAMASRLLPAMDLSWRPVAARALQHSAHPGYQPAGDPMRQDEDNYSRQLRYVDSLVGRLMTTLRESGAYGRSTIVITSDHEYRALTALADHGHVPVLVKRPQQSERHDDDRPVRTEELLASFIDGAD